MNINYIPFVLIGSGLLIIYLITFTLLYNSLKYKTMKLIRDKIKKIKYNIRRKHCNDPSMVAFFLDLIECKSIIHDTYVFIQHDNDLVDTLKKLGFIIESSMIFDYALCMMYWEKYNIEIELVEIQYWGNLEKACIICDRTEFNDLNDIYEVLR